MGSQNRFKAWSFSLGDGTHTKGIYLHPSRGQGVPASRGMCSEEQPSRRMPKGNEGIPQKLENSGNSVLDLLRRFCSCGKFTTDGANQLAKMLQVLENYGMVGNLQKSQLIAPQEVHHLIFTVDFKQGPLKAPQKKLKAVKNLLTRSEKACRKMAAILGATRSFLIAMPFGKDFADQVVHFVNQQEISGWDHKVPIPSALQHQVQEMYCLMGEWKGRKFQGKHECEFYIQIPPRKHGQVWMSPVGQWSRKC